MVDGEAEARIGTATTTSGSAEDHAAPNHPRQMAIDEQSTGPDHPNGDLDTTTHLSAEIDI